MRIQRFIPVPKPEFTMTFTRDEGWAIVAALRDFVAGNEQAAHRDAWKQWADDLDRELRA